MDIKIKIIAEVDESTRTNSELEWILGLLHTSRTESRTILHDGKLVGYTEFELEAVVNGKELLNFLQRDDSHYLDVPVVK